MPRDRSYAEIKVFIDLVAILTAEQWDAARAVGREERYRLRVVMARNSARNFARRARRGSEWDGAGLQVRMAAGNATGVAVAYAEWAAQALTVRDLLADNMFELLFAPMRAAGVDLDWLAANKYGPNSAQVRAFIDHLPTLTAHQWELARAAHESAGSIEGQKSARREAWIAAMIAMAAVGHEAWFEAGETAKSAVSDGVQSVVGSAAEALVVRDLISPEQFDLLFAPMRAVGIDPAQLVPNADESGRQ